MAAPAAGEVERRRESRHGKLFVGGVPVGTTEDELRGHFAGFGKVVAVVAPTNKQTGDPRGFAFVQFASPEDADRALAAGSQAHVVNGGMLDVKIAEPKLNDRERHSGDDSSQHKVAPNNNDNLNKKKIFVGGLCPTVDDDQLKEYFKVFGEITRAIVVTKLNTSDSRGFGFIEFSSEESANRALENARHCLSGLWAEVKMAAPKTWPHQAASSSSNLSAHARSFYPPSRQFYPPSRPFYPPYYLLFYPRR